ncbi:MAG: DUF748 domain-containing protein [Planctomycetota bacterium]|nr:DUF748 domain-containing protein [Planctomycetota bacterium]
MTSDSGTPPTKPAAPPASAAAVPPRAPHRWRRRFGMAFLVLLVLAVVFRIALIWLMPAVLRQVARTYQLDCAYDRMELSLLGGDVGIWGLKLTPLPASPGSASPTSKAATTAPAATQPAAPVIQAEYCRAYISPLALLQGRLHARRLEADAAEVLVDREPDGRIPLLDRFLAMRSPAAMPAAAPGKPASADLVPPLRVDALRVQRLKARFRDRSVSPVVDSQVVLDLRVSDLGVAPRPIRYEIDLSAESLLEGLRLEGEAKTLGRSIDATARLRVRSLRVKPAAGYLSMLGLQSLSNEISGQLESRITLTVSPPPTSTITGSLLVSDLSFSTDGREVFGLDRLTLGPVKIGSDTADLSKLVVEGARLHSVRRSDGTLRVAGFEMMPQELGDSATAPATTRPAVAAQTQPTTRPLRYPLSIKEILLKKARADFRDEAVTPAAELALEIDDLVARTPNDTRVGDDLSLEVVGALRSPNLARSVRVSGTARPFASTKTASLKLAAQGVKLDAVRPYLDMVLLESELRDANVNCDINAALTLGPHGSFGGELHMSGLKLEDHGDELLAVDELHVSGIGVDPQVGRIRVDDIQLVGPAIIARREASGGFAAFGFHTKPLLSAADARRRAAASAPAPGEETASQPAAESAPIPIPKFEIGHFGWHEFRLRLSDLTVTPASHVVVTDAGIDLSDIRFDLDAPEPDPKPGKIYVWFFAPGLAESLRVDGEFIAKRNSIAATMQVRGKGLDATPLVPYVQGMGFEPTLRHGSLKLDATVSLNRTAEGLSAALAVDHMSYADGATQLAAVESLRMEGLRLRQGEIELDSLSLEKPHGHLVREADGAMLVGGVRLPPRPAAPATTQPAGPPLALPFVAVLKKLHLHDGSLAWIDQVPKPAVSTIISGIVDLGRLTLGKSAEPATLEVSGSAAGAVENLTLKGVVSPDPEGLSAKLDVTASGLKAGSLAPYLPTGLDVSLRDGRLKTGLDAQWVRHAEGGQRGHVKLTGLELRDGPDGPPVLALASAGVGVTRLDIANKIIALDELTLTAGQARVRRAADGALEMPAITFRPAPPTTGRKGYELPTVYPLITIERLDLQMASLALVDATLPHSPEVGFSDLRLRSTERIETLGPQASLRPSIEFELTGKPKGLADSLKLSGKLSPFGTSARADLDLTVSGIHGPAWLKLAPELAEFVNAEELQRAVLHTHVNANVRLDRRSPLDFDLSRGFEFGLVMRDTTFSEGPEEEVLGGFDELRIEGGRVEPKFASVEIRSIEITKPMGHFVRDTDGLRAFACVFKLPDFGVKPATQPATRPAAPVKTVKVVDAADGKPAPFAAPFPRPEREIRVGKLSISGIDAMLEDWVVDPALFIPLTGLEFEAHDLTNLVWHEPKPVRFSLLLNSGKVSLPKDPLPPPTTMPSAAGPAATGPAGTQSATAPVRLHLPPVAMESREPFAQIAGSGRVVLYPAPTGWVKTSISGLELQALRGTAKAEGVTIYSGMFDGSADLRLTPDGVARVQSRLVFTDMRVYEPPNGPIFRLFHLPAPLDVAIGVLQDPDGSITLPIGASFSPNRNWADELVGSVIGEVPGIVATALASAPMKALGIKGERNTKPEPPAVLAFEPGSTVLDGETLGKIEALLVRLRKDETLDLTVRHALGGGDVALAKVRANPTREDCLSLVAQLRERKADLSRLREEVAGRARGQLASRFEAETAEATLARLRAIDTELAQTEDSLDSVSAMLRPGAARQADRRSRAASLEIARQRMEAVRRALFAGGVRDIQRRVQFYDPSFTVAPGPGGGQVTLGVVKGASK